MYIRRSARIGQVIIPGNRLSIVPKISREQIMEKLNISQSDLVLEVGSGDNPVHRSDVLSDKHLEYTPDREGREIHLDKRPFVACDALKLPFKDESFDYIIARQMLEYVDDPGQFLGELMRVGKRGYIEVANGIREVLFDWDARKYVVSVDEGGKLRLREKVGKGPLGDLFHKLRDPYLAKFINDNWSLFNYVLEWEGEIDYIIDEAGIDSVSLSRELNVEFPEDTDSQNLGNRIKALLRAIIALLPATLERKVYQAYASPGRPASVRRANPVISLEELLKIMACPVCRGELSFLSQKTAISCQSCKRLYPCVVRNKKVIPVMLEKETLQ